MNSLRKARQLAGYTQKELAELSGVKQPIISNIENGKVVSNPETKRKIEQVLGYVDWLSFERVMISGSYAEAQKVVRTLKGIQLGMDVYEKRALWTLLWKHFRMGNRQTIKE